ncbi:MAG: MMPL family transporter [Pseudomonadales bacterium]
MQHEVVGATAVPDGVRVRLTGEVVLATEEIAAALEGIGIAGTVSMGLLAIILGFGVRSLRIVGGIFLLLLLLGTALTVGFATLAVGTFNTLALMFVIMFFGLGVDFAVRFAPRVRDAHAAGESDLSATTTAAADIGPALLLCMLTSCVAFLAFVPADYRGLAELGIISAGGMVIALAPTLALLPALFGAFGMSSRSWGGAVRRNGDRPAWQPVDRRITTVAKESNDEKQSLETVAAMGRRYSRGRLPAGAGGLCHRDHRAQARRG